MFEIPEGHTPVVLIGGGTEESKFSRCFEESTGDKATNDMDANTSRAGMPLHPVLVLIVKGKNGHLHALMNLPLQKWDSPLVIEDSIEESRDVRRVTDWVAGFMHTFCANDTISAIDLITNAVLIGKESTALEVMVRGTRPTKDMRLESIGSVDDILNGQLGKEEIEAMTNKPEEGAIASLERLLVEDKTPELVQVPIINKDEEMRAQQQEIVDKYGWQALVDITKRMKTKILIKK